jgi:hypothetical protein
MKRDDDDELSSQLEVPVALDKRTTAELLQTDSSIVTLRHRQEHTHTLSLSHHGGIRIETR